MFAMSCNSIIYSNSEIKFFEDNLLNEDDWVKDNVSDIGNFSESPSSSSSERAIEDYCSIGFTNNYIDCWLNDDLDKFDQHDSANIKKEPLSPNKIFTSSIANISDTGTSLTFCSLPQETISENIINLGSNASQVSKNGHIQTNNISSLELKYNPTSTKVIDKPLCHNNIIKPKIFKIENGNFVGQNENTLNTTLTHPHSNMEFKDFKRQMRMIKNRESACLSRQRKKEHIKTLESRVSAITEVNQQLKEENCILKQRVQELENENELLRNRGMLKSGVKRSSAMLSLLLFYYFNPLGLFNVNQVLPGQPVQSLLPMHRSRTLLQFDNSNTLNFFPPLESYDEKEKARNSKIIQLNENIFHNAKNVDEEFKTQLSFSMVNKKEITNKLLKKNQTVKKNPSVTLHETEADCGEHFNETDVNRITESLEQLVHSSTIKKSNKIKNARRYPCYSTNVAARGKNLINNTGMSCNQTSPLTQSSYLKLLREKEKKRRDEYVMNNSSQELVNAIQKTIIRKADTFYLFTLKDYMMLPATNYSSIQRPKVTFMLPAYMAYSNISASNKNNTVVKMLQIDCHVIDTKLIDVGQDLLPKDLIPKLNS
ncbi:cyclic AMP-dependent transcription factor ATF-6 beta isoform X2 [Hydra vulgaris]|uniref:Cyclic AMP-dependent transcription factor ATF-6 beta isoform X2 n=1 Tax=Hydra vulgaris TaxID=6087 RepID=A0ABM4BD82_HYDVU